mmetsp:Transcript_16668/g.68238  ORF Transcript_16668/g.68238 Transcript_16668/m.68238 type:complete len:294 (+) Transcript_16668:381-1262(+)|eukprot:CAMPEP_0113965012 /NCGR_PEP_ID=MMETSP0011_2-20120614/7501_1 /TAXON_ID=101924 /ORGANISM="Rhodosorus marinus" /LENGTH=293 /DNA_ID=CAMNT_0000977463 /DNA_START=199 /DNA_END=1080 /DNA_ORIENTATION=+ /assembly_acc=CAM_ASM_000156
MITSFYEASDPNASTHLENEPEEFKGIKLADHLADYEDYQQEHKTPDSPHEGGGYGYNMKKIDDENDEYYEEDEEDDDIDQDHYYDEQDEEGERERQKVDTAAEEDDADAVDSGYYGDSQEGEEAEGSDVDGEYYGESENAQRELGMDASNDGAAGDSTIAGLTDSASDGNEGNESYGEDEDEEAYDEGEDDLEGDETDEDEGEEYDGEEDDAGEYDPEEDEPEEDEPEGDVGEEDTVDSAEAGDAMNTGESPLSIATAADQKQEDDAGMGVNASDASTEAVKVESEDDMVLG